MLGGVHRAIDPPRRPGSSAPVALGLDATKRRIVWRVGDCGTRPHDWCGGPQLEKTFGNPAKVRYSLIERRATTIFQGPDLSSTLVVHRLQIAYAHPAFLAFFHTGWRACVQRYVPRSVLRNGPLSLQHPKTLLYHGSVLLPSGFEQRQIWSQSFIDCYV